MGHWEWRSGDVLLPANAFSRVRAAVVAAYNAREEEVFESAKKAYAAAKAVAKVPRNPVETSLRQQEAAIRAVGGRPVREGMRAVDDCGRTDYPRVFAAIFTHEDPRLGWKSPMKLTRPTEKRVVHRALLAAPRTLSLDGTEGSISFDKGTRRVQWETGEGRHVVDEFNNHPVGRAFRKALADVKWVRGTGGVERGNDEINAENKEDGGSYITRTYGPLGEKEIHIRRPPRRR